MTIDRANEDRRHRFFYHYRDNGEIVVTNIFGEVVMMIFAPSVLDEAPVGRVQDALRDGDRLVFEGALSRRIQIALDIRTGKVAVAARESAG